MSAPADHEARDGAKVPSDPRFFRVVKRAFEATIAGLLLLAFAVPAPLQGPADPGRVPNPVKSAWFLLWTQELVSYSGLLVYLLLAFLVAFLFLPWWPGTRAAVRARWFPPGQWPATVATALVFGGILALTVVAAFFRGVNWALALPW